MPDAALAAKRFQHGKEFVLAVKTAIRAVFRVVGIVEFVGRDVFVTDSKLQREGFRVSLVRFGDGGGVGGHGNRAVA